MWSDALKVHHAGKMGDLVYALPAIRALARREGPITIITSGLCYQMAPLLTELSYIEDVEVDASRAYHLDGHICPQWEFFTKDEGLNLSIQPNYYEKGAPVSWTHCYAKQAGVELIPADCLVFPNLINHRRWLESIDASFDGVPEKKLHNIVLAPESETLKAEEGDYWNQIISQCLNRGFNVIVVGKEQDHKIPKVYQDLRGLTSVPTVARIIAEAAGFIGAHSLPWHLARHSGVPAVCVQRKHRALDRCIPIDTPYQWIEPHEYMKALDLLKL